jgi:RHS repeat-associated protein
LTYRYDTSGRLTEEVDGEQRCVIGYDGFGQPATVTRSTPEATERIEATFNGDGLLTSLILTTRPGHRREEEPGEERSASIRYQWSTGDQLPQILTQQASPELEDAEQDRPGRLSADFAYGYGRTFASWEHGSAAFHTDAFGSAIRTEATEPWVQAASYGIFGLPWPGENGGREHPGRRHEELRHPELPRFGYRGELALGPLIYLRARIYDAALGRFTTRDPVTPAPGSTLIANPYAYAGNDPLNFTDPTGQQLGILHDIERGAETVAGGVGHTLTTAGRDLGNWLGRDLGGWLGRDLGNDIVRGIDFLGHETVSLLDRGRHDAAVILHDVKQAAATVIGIILRRLLGRLSAPPGAGLDTNVVIRGLDKGQMDKLVRALNRRAPVVSPQAQLEYLAKSPDPRRLNTFLQAHQGRIGSQVSAAEFKAVQKRAQSITDRFGNRRNLTDEDARVVASTMKDRIPLIANDNQIIRFLQAIHYPVEPWEK